MIIAGLDIGSRTVKLVVSENGKVQLSRKQENSFDPLKICKELIRDIKYDVITTTGYGRHLFEEHFDCQVISEIKAFALGVRSLYPLCHTILDIGGQDTKAIALDNKGKIKKFEMNDKCAAGTGRFLEIMAAALGFRLKEFGQAALTAKRAEKINSMCTVFAESEIISMASRGARKEDVSLGIHKAIVRRSVTMMQRVSIEDEVVFVGGVALNPCIPRLLEDALGKKVNIPEDPQIIGALGCTLNGLDN